MTIERTPLWDTVCINQLKEAIECCEGATASGQGAI